MPLGFSLLALSALALGAYALLLRTQALRLRAEALALRARGRSSLEIAQKLRVAEEARDAAVAASCAKSEFLANMSHEIRTPMTAILGYADMLADSGPTPAERAESVQRIRRSGHHLLAILNDILDISKIEAGKMTVELIECDVPRIVAEVLSLMRPRAIEKRLSLDAEYSTPVPRTIRTDPTRLRQILMNLIGNSVKFTSAGGVRLTIGMSGPRISFTVTDTGIGMSATQIQALFQPFIQADHSTARKFGGTGLGLTISKRLAEMLGGGITVASETGSGSTFTLDVETGPLEGVPMCRPSNTSEMVLLDAPDPAAKIESPKNRPLEGLRVLLADDARDNQKIISYHLRKAGASVDSAEDGRVASATALAAQKHGSPYAVVLMDMQMPELDGFSATRLLRASGYRYPIVALTAHAMAGDREACLACGCDDYTTKPIDPVQLIAVVGRWGRGALGVDGIPAPLPARDDAVEPRRR